MDASEKDAVSVLQATSSARSSASSASFPSVPPPVASASAPADRKPPELRRRARGRSRPGPAA